MIYLASPYSHDDPDVRQRRFAAACMATARLMQETRGAVYSPIAHGHAIEDVCGPVLDHAGWMAQCLPMLALADGLVVLMLDGWRESSGVAAEIEYARALGIDIEYVESD